MKTPVRTRLLSALLSLVMLVSLLPVSVFAAEPASGTWEKVTEAQEDWSGQYLIVYEKGSLIMDGSLSALDKEGNKVDVTITDGKIVGDYAKYAFTIAPMTGGWSVQSASGKYISGKSGKNKIITGSTPELNTITFADGNVKIASNNTTLQYNAAATNGTRFRYYKSENQQPVALYKLSTVPARESGIVTDLTTLQNGDKVVVFNPANKKALSSVYNGFYNTGVDVELTGGKLTGYTDAELWTVNRTESGAYTFSTAEGKKLSMDTSYSSTPLDKANVDWELSAAATADCFYIKNVGRGSYLEWFAEKNNWSSYGTIGSNEPLFAQQLYLVADTQKPDQPGQPDDPTAPLKNGDQVVIYNPANLKALSTEYTGFYNKGTDVTLTGGKLSGFAEADIWTVGVNDDGSYTFSTADGKKLSMDEKYSSTPLDKAHTAWTLEQAATEGCYYIKNMGRSSYLEWYAEKNNWSAFGTIGSNEALFAQAFFKIQKSGIVTSVSDGDQVVVFNPANGKALSTEYTGFYNKGTDVTLANGKLSGYTKADIWTVGVNADGSYTFSTADGKKLSMDEKYSSTPLDKTHTGWSILPAATENCVYIQNVGRSSYLEWYAEKNNWSAFGTIGSNEALFAQQLYLVGDETDQPAGSLPQEGAQVVLFNQNAQGVLAGQNDNTDSPAVNNVSAQVANGKAIPGNGGVVFTVERSGEYYRFRNETYGYLCSNGTGNNAFYSLTASDDADWTVEPCSGGVGGYQLESRTAKFNGRYSQFLEYYSDSYKTYSMYNSMYNVTDYTIYSFFFYGVADSVKLDGGIVNDPAVKFTSADSVKGGQDYTLTFTVDDAKAVQKLEILVDGRSAGVITDYTADGSNYTANVPAAMLAGSDQVTFTVRVTNVSGASYSGSLVVTVVDEPSIGAVTPLKGSQTGSDKRPVISAELINAGENPTVEMTVNGEKVNAVCAGGKATYTPAADMTDGRTNVTVTVTRADGKSASFSWFFTVGESRYQLYFGQLHSHTQYSDGAGSLESALSYVKNLPDSANVQFVAFTDHSNYFDKSGAANPEGALYDMSLATPYSQETWNSYRSAVAAFNEANAGSLVALAGFEMTWSGGPGHINTFNTPGIVSRNNTTLNNKTDYAGMRAYYALLSQQEGADSLSQFNHPGNTFGTFGDFAFWDPVIDSRMYMVEAGNGEGQIGAGGYYPSYEYYTMALDKGWHLAPTNNQDNHKGRWGNANDARDVILTDDFSEEGIYDALRAMRMYATEDKNLEIGYTVNGMLLGSSLTEVPEKLNIHVTVNDPDASDSISKVEVIVNSGKTAYTWDDPAVLATGDLSVTLDPDYSYYYIRVTQGDGDLAVTAPVWVGETLKLGISDVTCGTSTPVTGEKMTVTTTLFNSESTDARIKSITYAVGSQVLASATDAGTVPASGTLDLSYDISFDTARVYKVTATVVLEQDGKEYVFTKDITLDVLNADDLVYIGIDASHYNEYVAGNYKDSMGNFGNLAGKYNVRTVELKTSDDLIAACSNPKFKALILTAPSRRLADAQTDPRTYSAAELAAITAFNAGGGTVILAGWSDNYENYDVIQSNPAIKHMAATQNEVLQALGSSLRIADDATYDDVRSAADGVDKWRLYFNTYGQSFLTDGVEVDPAHPYDRLYTEVFSHYGGASVYAVDADGNPTSALPATVTPVVYTHPTTYSVDVDKDGLGGANVPKYAYAENDSRLLAMASEQLEGKGLIIVSGAAFMSNFEVQATISDNGSEKNYSNYKICENLLGRINPVKITDIATVQAQTEAGHKYTIEGIVTSNASGYDKATAFFDCIYVQDETGGINCFPVAGDFKIGDVVRVTGVTETYQGENELQVSSIEKIGETTPVTPRAVTSTQINDGSVLGQLVTLNGYVTGYEMADGLVQTILVRDSEGKIARVFIDGYITTSYDVANLSVGCQISATGLASYDNTFVLADGTPMAPRIRVRDRNDVVCTAHEHTFGEWIVTTQPTCTEPGEKTRTCTGCGEVETMVIDATGHHYKDGKCTDCGAADPGYQPTQPGVKTGDESNTTMWIIVLVCAAALAVVLVIVSRKKRNS
ncbi:MAG TPA: hypothetical protein DGS89_07525 [Oscillibacter sp.]|nr:hypothetical protein [Oscillibacter sp.]HCV07534.1 hypothetical protein [Oscillibacter sp.]